MKRFRVMPSPLTVRKELRRGSRTFAPGSRFPWHQMAICVKSVRALIDQGFLEDPFAEAPVSRSQERRLKAQRGKRRKKKAEDGEQ